jgi:hypothetical protein
MNEIETKRIRQRVSERKHCFFGKMNKDEKSLANLAKSKKEKTKIHRIRDEKEDIITQK